MYNGIQRYFGMYAGTPYRTVLLQQVNCYKIITFTQKPYIVRVETEAIWSQWWTIHHQRAIALLSFF